MGQQKNVKQAAEPQQAQRSVKPQVYSFDLTQSPLETILTGLETTDKGLTDK